MGTGVPASIRVVQQLSEREGVDPQALEPRLYDVVDPDALDALIESAPEPAGSAEPSITVEFEYGGRSVSVDDTGRVHVAESVVGSGRRSSGD